MTPEEIRNTDLSNASPPSNCGIFLREIAAQLAELNALLREVVKEQQILSKINPFGS